MRDHLLRVRRNAVAMKGGLREPTLLQMELAFADEQAIAEHFLEPVNREPFREEAIVRDEDVLDELRMIDEVDGVLVLAESELHDVAVFARQPAEELEWIAPHANKRGSGS